MHEKIDCWLHWSQICLWQQYSAILVKVEKSYSAAFVFQALKYIKHHPKDGAIVSEKILFYLIAIEVGLYV